MIITRTPLRISLGGGGTDLPSYYEERGHGHLVAAAISKYIYVSVNQNFANDLFLKYSQYERVDSVSKISHPILRECLDLFGITKGIEVNSMADVPSGTGLGSSGSFTVGVLKALSHFCHESKSNNELAKLACEVEIDRLQEPVGKQDQYIAALGGVTSITFYADGRVESRQLQMSPLARTQLEENLLLFYTGHQRSAIDALKEERSLLVGSRSTKSNLDEMRDLGYQTARCLETGDLGSLGDLLSGQWSLKYKRQPSLIHDQINDWIERGCRSGASGGKLVGAGGGGFLLFYASDKNDLRLAMEGLGLPEVPFRFDYEGSVILVSR